MLSVIRTESFPPRRHDPICIQISDIIIRPSFISGLFFRITIDPTGRITEAKCYLRFPVGISFFGRNDNDTGSRTRTVESSRSRTFKYGYIVYIFRIDVHYTIPIRCRVSGRSVKAGVSTDWGRVIINDPVYHK